MFRPLLATVIAVLTAAAVADPSPPVPSTEPSSEPPGLRHARQMYRAPLGDLGRTWVDSGGVVYGARPDAAGPLGGGAGYADTISDGDHRADTVEALLAALASATSGQTVFLPGDAVLDLTPWVLLEDLVIEVPAGVTLASDRGRDGSPGALLFSDAMATRPLLRTAGAGVRVTGLRIRGPDPERRLDLHRLAFREGRGSDYYYAFPTSDGIDTRHDSLRVDNCELAGWSHAAVNIRAGVGHRVHHSFLHHNQRQGLGYGVCIDVAEVRIHHNLFDANRHSIAGTGRSGGAYEAHDNVELGTSLSHCFDMHGGRDRGDGTDVAGSWIRIHHNTFRSQRRPIVVRGTPQEGARVWGNWFPHHSDMDGARPAVRTGGGTDVGDNLFGR